MAGCEAGMNAAAGGTPPVENNAMQETKHPRGVLPPGPQKRIPLWKVRSFREDLLEHIMRLKRDYGDISSMRFANFDIVVLGDPDHVKRVLVNDYAVFEKSLGMQRMKFVFGEGLLTSEGEFHRRQRQLVAPAFHREALKNYAEDMIAYAVRTRDAWQDGAEFDVNQEMMRLTLAIVAKTLFDANVDDAADTVGKALEDLLENYTKMFLPLATLLVRVIPSASNRRLLRGRRTLDKIIYGLIDQRRASGETGTDLLGMLLASREEGGGGGMTPRQVRDEAMTLFLAGHETTAVGLSWTWKLLSENPEVRAKLEAELEEVLQGRTPSYEDYPKLTYTRKVFQESMRIYPPAYATGRRLKQDYEIGGYTLRAKKTMIFVSPYLMHHDARWFPEPERFDPDRWTPEFEAGLHKFAYFPFGGGPRICIGANFAWMEAVLVLATLAQRWRIHLLPGQDIKLSPQITLRPSPGIQVRLEAR